MEKASGFPLGGLRGKAIYSDDVRLSSRNAGFAVRSFFYYRLFTFLYEYAII